MKVYSVMLIILFSLTTSIFSQVQWAAHTIIDGEYNANGARSVYAVDVDGDGDMDVLSASEFDDKIAWYENDDSQNFTAHAITTGADLAQSVYAEDVDGDGDMDVLSASENDDKIAWYENLGPVGIVNDDAAVVPLKPLLYNNYPNPFNPSTTIEFDLPKTSKVKLKIFNILGEEVSILVSEKLPSGSYSYEWDASLYASGVYYYRLVYDAGFIRTKKMLLLK